MELVEEIELQEPPQQPDPPTKKRALYDAVSKKYNLGTYEEYETKLKDPTKRKALYDFIGKEYDLGTYQDFESKISEPSKKKVGTIGFEESSLESGNALSQSGGVDGEQIPTIEMYTAPNGEMIEANPIALSKKYNELSTKTKEIEGLGDRGTMKVVDDEDARKSAAKLKEDFKDIDLGGIYEETKDIPDDVIANVGKELMQDREQNYPLYQRKLANIKWRHGLEQQILADVDNGNITPENYNRIKDGIEMLPTFTGSGDYSNQRGAIQSLAKDIQLYGGANKQQILQDFAVEVSKVYGSAYKNNFDKYAADTPESKYLNNDEQLALQYLKDIAPEQAEQYDRLMIDPKLVKDDPDALKGYNRLKQTLEETGIGLQLNSVKEELNNLNNIADRDGALTDDQISKAVELEKKYGELTQKLNELDKKYPERIEDKVDDALQEIRGQKISGLNYFGGTAYRSIKNTGQGIWEAVSTPFMSDASNTFRELSIMGEGIEQNNLYHKTDKNTAILTSEMVIEPELQKQIDAITNNKVMSESEKDMKVYRLLKDNTDKFGRVPVKGGKFNINPSSIMYGLSDLGTMLLPFVALETVTGGGATAGLARKFISTFTAAAATTFHAEYESALLSGVSQSDAYKEAMGMTAISSLAMAGAGTPAKIKAMVNPKTSAGQLILGMSDDAIQKVLDKGVPKGLKAIGDNLKERAKAIPKQLQGGLKTGTEFEVAMTAANEAKHQIYGTEIDREANFKNSLLMIGNFSGLGLMGQARFKTPTQMQKGAGLMFGAKPKEYIAVAEQMRKDGQLNESEFNKRVELINQFGDAYKSVPKDLPENRKAEYLYQTVIKNEANKGKSDLPPKQAAQAEHTALVADYTREMILEPPTDKQLESRKNTLEKQMEAKDAEGKLLLDEKEQAKVKAQLEAVNNESETRKSFEKVEMKKREFVDTKLSEPVEGLNEQGIPIGDNVPKEIVKDEGVIVEPPKEIPEPIKLVDEKTETIEVPNAKEKSSDTAPTISEVIPETKIGKEGKEPPPAEPTDTVGEGKGDRLNDKGILNHLESATNVPEAAKAGFRDKGLKYETKSQKEAEDVAKSVIDQYGIEDAVLLAEAQKFDGDVNSLIYAESLNRLGKSEDAAKTPEEKLAIAKQFAEVGIKYDEAARKGGRFTSAINYFYKKSPLGIQMIENAKRKEQFEQWAKPKEKSWKEFFDEMSKEPEFDAIVKEQVREGMKKERAEARAERIKKVDEFFNKAKDQFKGGAAYSTIIPPKVITTALEGMKQAYHAGEKVAKLIEDAVDYISKELGNASWDKDKFRKEWEEKLKDKPDKKKLSDEEAKAKILDRFRNKLKGLSDKQKEDVVRKSFQKIVESGGLDYADFRKIIAEVTGRNEMTDAEAAKLKQLVIETNKVDDAATKARAERTPESLKAYREAEVKAGAAQRELNTLLYNRPNVTKRLTSMLQLNTLGFAALVNNPVYNVINQLGIRVPVGIIKTALDKAIQLGSSAVGKEIKPETDVLSLQVQKEFFKKLGLGGREALGQFLTGLNRMDYIQKEIHGQQIRPITSMKELWEYSRGERNLTKTQVVDKLLQALPQGWTAEIIARTLNLGDKPQRFASEGAQAAAFAKSLGVKNIDYKLFIEFPREEAYRVYKAKGLSDAEAAKKADYVRDTIIKEGERSTFQQDNIVNDALNRLFGGKDSGAGGLIKATVVSPYIKIPANAYWSYFNIVNPEVAMLQSAIYGAKAYLKKYKGYERFNVMGFGDKHNTSAAKDLNEAKYWFAHAAVGFATRAVITSLVGAGIFRSSNTADDSKKEREGEQNFESQGTVNMSKLWAWANGEDPSTVKDGFVVQNRWLGHFGSVGNTIAKKEEEMTAEQKENREDYWQQMLGNLDQSALPALEQGIFGNTSSFITALKRGGVDFQRWGVNTINMFANIAHPAIFSQVSKAQLPYYTKTKADTFGAELKNAMLTRSSWLRKLSGQYPPSKVSIWGEQIPKEGNIIEKLFGFSRANDDNFAQPIYEDYKKTDNTAFFPPAVKPEITVDGQRVKLTTKEASELEEMVGRNRKALIAPFINGYATYDGYSYKDLKTEEQKLAALKIIYEIGKDRGEDEFTARYPKFENKETYKSEERLQKEAANKEFREAMKNQ